LAVTPAVEKRPRFEQFFAIRRLQPTLAFSADGEHVLFSSNVSGQFNLWRVPTRGPIGWPEQLTSFTESSVRSIAVSPDGETLVIAADEHGDEFFQLYGLPRKGGWPEAWTEAPKVQHYVPHSPWSPDGSRFAYAANARTPTDMEVWVRDEESDEPRSVFGEGKYSFAATWSPDGKSLLVLDVRSNTDMTIHLVDPDSGEARELTPHDGDAKFAPGPWEADGSGFYFLTDEGREFSGLAFYRLEQGRYEWIETPDSDLDELAGSDDGRVLAWLENRDGWSRLRLRELERGEDLPEPRLPPGCIHLFGSGLSPSRDGRYAALIWQQPRRSAEVFVIDVETGEAWPVTESMVGGLEEDNLGEPELVSFPTREGHEVPAWLYRPDVEGRAPVVVSIHGGPEAQERPWYQPLYQYLRSLGFAVLAPNVRGSTGYGKRYQKLIQRDWGGGDLADFEHMVRWLRAQEWVDGDRLAVIGGSYGGFAVLTCVTRMPDEWAAAVDIFGPSNLVTFARSVPPTWRRFMANFVGDPETEQDFLLERSPLTYAANVRTPLMVIQGANDPRVVQEESDQLVYKLRLHRREVEYVVFEDEGHGFTKRENELRAYRLAADWLERHLT
jgi:dipeptidyl aminopeptidase/acylaminoacyl peptidase